MLPTQNLTPGRSPDQDIETEYTTMFFNFEIKLGRSFMYITFTFNTVLLWCDSYAQPTADLEYAKFNMFNIEFFLHAFKNFAFHSIKPHLEFKRVIITFRLKFLQALYIIVKKNMMYFLQTLNILFVCNAIPKMLAVRHLGIL